MSEKNKESQSSSPAMGPMGRGWGPPGGIGVPVQKARNFRGTLLRLARYFRPQSARLTVVAVAAVLSTVFSIISPNLLGNATTALFAGIMSKHSGLPGSGIDFAYIGRIVIELTVLYVLSSAFSYVQQVVMAGVAQNTVYALRKQVNEKLTRLPLRFYDDRPFGDILSRFINDFDNISNTLQQSLTQLITSVITLIGVIAIMLWISPIMTIVIVLTLPLSFVATVLIAKRSQRFFVGQQRSLGELNAHVEEMFTGHTIVKAYGKEHNSITAFNQINERLYESGWKAQFISGIIMPVMNFIGNIGYVLICVIGGVLVTRGTINIGDILKFIQYARQFSQPITQLSSISNIIQSTVASAERVFELLDEPEESADSDTMLTLDDAQGNVCFEHVVFGYQGSEPLMTDMNIDVRSGQMVAIVGPTGAGKTTLVNLLMRFYELDGGRITVDGVAITDLRRGDLRSLFGMVLQDTWLFNGTIRENIGYSREDASFAEIVAAAEAAHADHFIRTLPEGYDTVLNEEATNLSQGQKQLLTIARAILSEPKILILDEATSSVDTRTEAAIQSAMKTLMQARTSFVIAHRLSTIRAADLILVMQHGSVVEQGTHDELLLRDGVYADLYNSQFAARATQEMVSAQAL